MAGKPNVAVHQGLTGVFWLWAKVVQLKKLKLILHILKATYPAQVSIQAVYVEDATDPQLIPQSMFWPFLLEAQDMQMDHIHSFRCMKF